MRYCFPEEAKTGLLNMRIGLFAVGRLKAGPEKDLAARYLDRFAKTGPGIGLEFSRVIEVNESRASSADTRKREEAALLEKSLPDSSLLILLDERGKALDSEGFATVIGNFRDGGKRDLMVAIGGADGLDPALHAKADAVICLGKMTWPHQLVRILIAEQLYRAVTILSGHPYHRV
jgi:23S rRNA (pseudouridine1915-N3)-methyltransferase